MKKIAIINDLSGFGRCSLTAALPVISALGIEACPLPTAILSHQTGYPSFFCTDYTANMPAFISEWKKQGAKFDGILTGYIASEKQAELIGGFIDEFAGDNTLVFVDPVMADDGELYDTYDKTLCENVKRLTEKADIITPNLTELCVLCGADYKEICKDNNLDKVVHLARSLMSEKLKTVIVTGIKLYDEIINLVVEKEQIYTVKKTLLNGSFSGTGDIFSSIVCGAIINGKAVYDAVELATDFIFKSIQSTPTKLDYEPNGVNFQSNLGVLINAK